MKALNPNWITEGLIDFEYKKYILLAYLQDINKEFNEQKLYPFLSDLIFHYNNLVSLKKNKELATNNFPQQVSKLDFENFKIQYEKMIEDDNYMNEIESILSFALPKIKSHLTEGKELYEFVENKLEIFPIGIVPLNAEAGYMMLREGDERDTRVYEYQITIFENQNEKFRGIKTEFIATYQISIGNTFEKIKIDLINTKRNLPNPATYAIESKFVFPLEETLLPIAKRSLVRFISKGEA